MKKMLICLLSLCQQVWQLSLVWQKPKKISQLKSNVVQVNLKWIQTKPWVWWIFPAPENSWIGILFDSQWEVGRLDILFLSILNIHKSSCGLCFWASLFKWIDFTKIFRLKGLKPQQQRPHELLWMLWFDEKSISKIDIPSSLFNTDT